MNPATYLQCGRCGWVHFAIAAADLSSSIDLAQVRPCLNCHAPAAEMNFCQQGDAPKGVTIPGILFENGDKVALRRDALDRLSLLDQELGLG